MFTIHVGAQMHINNLTNPTPHPSGRRSCLHVSQQSTLRTDLCHVITLSDAPPQLTLVKSAEACQPCHRCPLCVSQHSPNVLTLSDIPRMPRLDRVQERAGTGGMEGKCVISSPHISCVTGINQVLWLFCENLYTVVVISVTVREVESLHNKYEGELLALWCRRKAKQRSENLLHQKQLRIQAFSGVWAGV